VNKLCLILSLGFCLSLFSEHIDVDKFYKKHGKSQIYYNKNPTNDCIFLINKIESNEYENDKYFLTLLLNLELDQLLYNMDKQYKLHQYYLNHPEELYGDELEDVKIAIENLKAGRLVVEGWKQKYSMKGE